MSSGGRIRLPVLVTLALALASPASVARAAAPGTRLPAKSTEVNGITVEASPRRVDARGAVIAVTLDTHTVDLTVDLRRRSTLTVDGAVWPTTRYRGDGPGGHHRAGTLRFRAAGPAAGTMRLVIKGLGGTARLSWSLDRPGRT